MLAHLRSRGIDIITMDEVHQRPIERNFSRGFACFTSMMVIATTEISRCR
jgi:hypothetical protein